MDQNEAAAAKLVGAVQQLCLAFDAIGLAPPIAIVVEAGQTAIIEELLAKAVVLPDVQERQTEGMLTIAGTPLIEF